MPSLFMHIIKRVIKVVTVRVYFSVFYQVLAEQQQFDEADNTYKKALEIEPSNGTNMVQRGCETSV